MAIPNPPKPPVARTVQQSPVAEAVVRPAVSASRNARIVLSIFQLLGWSLCFLFAAVGLLDYLASETAPQQAAAVTLVVVGYVIARVVEKVAGIVFSIMFGKD